MNKQSGFSFIQILPVILIIVAIAIGAYFYTKENEQLSEIQENPVATNSPLPTDISNLPTASPSASPISSGQTQLTLDSLQFNIPTYWWSRRMTTATISSYAINPEPLCTNCDARPAIYVNHMINSKLATEKADLISGYFLTKTSEKPIAIINGSGINFEGIITLDKKDLPLPDGEKVHIVLIEKDNDLYEIGTIGSNYLEIFNQLVASVKIIK